jgi:replicative DNA helicase
VPEHFHYVEVAHYTRVSREDPTLQPAMIQAEGREVQGRGLFIHEQTLDTVASQYRSGVLSSHFRFSTSDAAEIESLRESGRLPVLGDYYIVFHAVSSADTVHAINQAIDIVERLKEDFDVPYEAVVVFYAVKEIQVHVDYTVFDAQPGVELPETYRRMTHALIGIDPHDTAPPAAYSQLNLAAYRPDYISHIPGTLVTADPRDTFKIRLSYAAFKRLSYQRLNEFTQRRPDLPPRDARASVVARARDFFNSVAASLQRDSRSGGDADRIADIFYRVDEASSDIATAKQLAPSLLKRLFNESRQVISTFSPHLNRVLAGGLNPGDLYVLAGFPGSGTSTLALQMLNQAAEEQGAYCLFVGLQRGIEELFKRSLSQLGRIPVSEIDEKRQTPSALYDDKDFNSRIFKAYERYQQFADRITIVEGAFAYSPARMTQLIRDRKEELRISGGANGGAKMLLVIDSLQLMVALLRSVGGRYEGDSGVPLHLSELDVRSLTGRLKSLARELDISILATLEHYETEGSAAHNLTQLFVDTQFADTVMLLSRHGASLHLLADSLRTQLANTPLEGRVDDLMKKVSDLEHTFLREPGFASLDSEFAILEVLKNRSGPVDKVALAFHKRFASFEPIEYQIP